MNLRLERMKKGMSQNQLADIVGVDHALISQYENGRRRPSIKTAKKIADVLGIYWADFYEDDENDRPEQKPESETV